MNAQDRMELTALLRKRVASLPEGPFKHRMETRVKLLDEVPREAWIALALVLLAMLGMWVYTKWAWRPLRALMVI